MKRRTLLKTSLVAGALGLIPFRRLLAQEPNSGPAKLVDPHKGYRRFALGDLEITVLTDGEIKEASVFPFVAPLGNAEEVKSLLEANFRPTDSIELAMNIVVVKSSE